MSIQNEKYNLGIMFYPGSNINRFRLLLQSLLYKRKEPLKGSYINERVRGDIRTYKKLKNIEKYNPFSRINPLNKYFKQIYLWGLMTASGDWRFPIKMRVSNDYCDIFDNFNNRIVEKIDIDIKNKYIHEQINDTIFNICMEYKKNKNDEKYKLYCILIFMLYDFYDNNICDVETKSIMADEKFHHMGLEIIKMLDKGIDFIPNIKFNLVEEMSYMKNICDFLKLLYKQLKNLSGFESLCSKIENLHDISTKDSTIKDTIENNGNIINSLLEINFLNNVKLHLYDITNFDEKDEKNLEKIITEYINFDKTLNEYIDTFINIYLDTEINYNRITNNDDILKIILLSHPLSIIKTDILEDILNKGDVEYLRTIMKNIYTCINDYEKENERYNNELSMISNRINKEYNERRKQGIKESNEAIQERLKKEEQEEKEMKKKHEKNIYEICDKFKIYIKDSNKYTIAEYIKYTIAEYMKKFYNFTKSDGLNNFINKILTLINRENEFNVNEICNNFHNQNYLFEMIEKLTIDDIKNTLNIFTKNYVDMYIPLIDNDLMVCGNEYERSPSYHNTCVLNYNSLFALNDPIMLNRKIDIYVDKVDINGLSKYVYVEYKDLMVKENTIYYKENDLGDYYEELLGSDFSNLNPNPNLNEIKLCEHIKDFNIHFIEDGVNGTANPSNNNQLMKLINEFTEIWRKHDGEIYGYGSIEHTSLMTSRMMFMKNTAYEYAMMADDDDLAVNGIDGYYEGIEYFKNRVINPDKQLEPEFEELLKDESKHYTSVIKHMYIDLNKGGCNGMWGRLWLPNSHVMVQTVNQMAGEDGYYGRTFNSVSIKPIKKDVKTIYYYIWVSGQGYEQGNGLYYNDAGEYKEIFDENILNNTMDGDRYCNELVVLRYDSIIKIRNINLLNYYKPEFNYISPDRNGEVYDFMTYRPIISQFGIKPRRFIILKNKLYFIPDIIEKIKKEFSPEINKIIDAIHNILNRDLSDYKTTCDVFNEIEEYKNRIDNEIYLKMLLYIFVTSNNSYETFLHELFMRKYRNKIYNIIMNYDLFTYDKFEEIIKYSSNISYKQLYDFKLSNFNIDEFNKKYSIDMLKKYQNTLNDNNYTNDFRTNSYGHLIKNHVEIFEECVDQFLKIIKNCRNESIEIIEQYIEFIKTETEIEECRKQLLKIVEKYDNQIDIIEKEYREKLKKVKIEIEIDDYDKNSSRDECIRGINIENDYCRKLFNKYKERIQYIGVIKFKNMYYNFNSEQNELLNSYNCYLMCGFNYRSICNIFMEPDYFIDWKKIENDSYDSKYENVYPHRTFLMGSGDEDYEKYKNEKYKNEKSINWMFVLLVSLIIILIVLITIKIIIHKKYLFKKHRKY